MADTVDPSGQQAQAPAQQAQTTQAPPAGYVEKSRFDGQVRTIEQLVSEKRTLEAELATVRAEVERLTAQISIKDAEKSAAVGERDRQIQTYVQSATETERELASLRALKLKVETANKLGNPALMQIADTIPDMTDQAALEIVMTNLHKFVSDQVKAREDQLKAGVAPAGGLTPPASTTPTTEDAWQAHIASIPYSKPQERRQAMDAYGKWLRDAHQGR